LIAPYWVLTAAHCGTVDSVIYGRKDLTDLTAGERIPVVEEFIHPSWNPVDLSNDIHLLRLAHPPAGAQPVQVAAPADDPTVSMQTLHFAGWGITQVGGTNTTPYLQEASLDYYTPSQCNIAWNALGVPVSASQICAAHFGADPSQDREVCNGDSGGPLINVTGGGDRLIGLASYTRPGCDAYPYPNVFTRVSSFYSWIHGYIDTQASGDVGSVSFGSNAIGGPAIPHSMNVINTGAGPVTVSGVAAAGASDFTMGSNGCIGVTLNVGETCPISFNYTPITTGLAQGNLHITFIGGYSNVALTANGIVGNNGATIKPKLAISQAGKSVKAGKKIKVVIKASFLIPANVNQTTACSNNILLTAKIPGVSRSLKTQGPALWSMARCTAKLTLKMPKKAKNKKVAFNLRFAGNNSVAANEQSFTLKIK
jgi:secreted trypsin-like serine protease